MKLALDLRRSIALWFLFLGLLLVSGYSMLSNHYFVRGMDNIQALHMERAAQYFLSLPQSERQQPYSLFGFDVTDDWQQIPQAYRSEFATPPASSKLIKFFQERSPNEEQLPNLLFLFHYQQGNQHAYVTHKVSRQTMSQMVGNNARSSRRNLLLISISAALALSLVIWLTLHRVSGPVSKLLQWTRTLNANTLKQPAPNFTFPELNQLAQLIKESLSSAQESLEREHRFLRHTSHELRTPITTIRNNVELLRKLQISQPENLAQQQQVTDRLDRASLTMKYLTETLLWLSRDSYEELIKSNVLLPELIQQLSEEMGYLLKDKPVSVQLTTSPHAMMLPEVAARIVLGNLIRNAFQHSWEGTVYIEQDGPNVCIRNSDANAPGEEDLGFGLGLNLTEQLCQRLDWQYHNESQNGERRAVVRFNND